MKLIVGLGNPGREYEGNRHNVGFMAVDRIATAHRFGPWKRKFQGNAADGEVAGEKILLLKPETYMNESGRAVGEAARFLKIDLSDIIVLYDEIDLAPGQLKVKTGGGNAGHNGLRSITQHLGNDYVRVRIGVGHPGARELVARWVLSDFAKADRTWLDPMLEAIAGALPRLATGDASRFLTDVQKLRGEPSDPRRTEGGRKGEDTTKAPDGDAPSRPAPVSKHPAGDRARKRDGAIAENLKKWLEARKPKD